MNVPCGSHVDVSALSTPSNQVHSVTPGTLDVASPATPSFRSHSSMHNDVVAPFITALVKNNNEINREENAALVENDEIASVDIMHELAWLESIH